MYFDENGYVYGYGSDYEEGSYKIDSIPPEVDRYLGAYKYDKDKDEFIPDNAKIAWLNRQWELERQINEIEQWFTWYDQQVVQYTRSQRLGLEFNRSMYELDTQAQANAALILQYREEIAQPFVPTENEI